MKIPKKAKEISKTLWGLIGRTSWYLAIFLSFYLLIVKGVPRVFTGLYGGEVTNRTLNLVLDNQSDPDEAALAIMKWEEKNFFNPYTHHNPNSTLNKLGIYKVNGSYKKFIRGLPPWTIYYKMANCEEYSETFVYLMEKAGFEARMIRGGGGDHKWAEYYSKGYPVAVNPSVNEVIMNKKKFAKGRNWSYVEAIEILDKPRNKDISRDYLDLGRLRVRVFKKSKPIEGIKVTVENPYLTMEKPNMYEDPAEVKEKKTNENGTIKFELGPSKHIIEVERNYLLFFDAVYQKNVSVVSNKERKINFNLSQDKRRVEFLGYTLLSNKD